MRRSAARLAGLALLAAAGAAAAHPPIGIVVDGEGRVHFSALTSV